MGKNDKGRKKKRCIYVINSLSTSQTKNSFLFLILTVWILNKIDHPLWFGCLNLSFRSRTSYHLCFLAHFCLSTPPPPLAKQKWKGKLRNTGNGEKKSPTLFLANPFKPCSNVWNKIEDSSPDVTRMVKRKRRMISETYKKKWVGLFFFSELKMLLCWGNDLVFGVGIWIF